MLVWNLHGGGMFLMNESEDFTEKKLTSSSSMKIILLLLTAGFYK